MTSRTKRMLTGIAAVAAVLLPLTACAGAAPDREPEAEADRPAADGSNLPFALPEGDTPAPPTQSSGPTPTPTASADPEPTSTGSDGADQISIEGVDVPDTSWDVICSPDAMDTYRVTASNDAGGYIYILVDGAGDFERFEFATDEDADTTYWYWQQEQAGQPSEADTQGPTFSGDTVTLSGHTFEYDDYDYANPRNYDLTLTCDTMS